MSEEQQYTILLVDDDPANLHLLVDQLFVQGFRLMVAKSGERALERATLNPPDIILLDVRMPNGINGFETCRRFKADPNLNAIPVIFLSASREIVDREEGLRVGGVDYITKPLEINEVLLRIRTHLTLRRLHLELAASHANLEARVTARTVELEAEIKRRTHSEGQQAFLLDLVRSQGTQLQFMTKQLLELQKRHRTALRLELTGKIASTLAHINQRIPKLISKITDGAIRKQFDDVTQELKQMEATVQQVTDRLQSPEPEETDISTNPLLKLSDREREVLILLANRHTTEEIAALLHISASTVRTYRYRISQKLGVDDNGDLLKLALEYLV